MLLQGVEHLLNPKEPMSDGCQKKLTPKGVVALGSDVKWWCKLVSNTSGSKKSSCKTLHTFHVACMRAIFLTNPCQPPKIDTSSVCEGVRWVSTNLFRLNSQDSPPALNGVDVKLEKKKHKNNNMTWTILYYTFNDKKESLLHLPSVKRLEPLMHKHSINSLGCGSCDSSDIANLNAQQNIKTWPSRFNKWEPDG